MPLYLERRLPSLSILLFSLCAATAAAASCDEAGGDRSIRNAVDNGATILISSHGTYIERPSTSPRARHVAAPPPALRLSLNDESAAPDQAELKDLVERARRRHEKIEITVVAFAADDPCRAERVAQGRAAALRDRLVAAGAARSQLRIRAIGRRFGHDRAEFRLI